MYSNPVGRKVVGRLDVDIGFQKFSRRPLRPKEARSQDLYPTIDPSGFLVNKSKDWNRREHIAACREDLAEACKTSLAGNVDTGDKQLLHHQAFEVEDGDCNYFEVKLYVACKEAP
jgi:hypothetical protein